MGSGFRGGGKRTTEWRVKRNKYTCLLKINYEIKREQPTKWYKYNKA